MNLFDWQTLGLTFLTVAMGTLIRSVILALLCAGAAWLLRSRSAALRFSLWKWNLLALFALPLLVSLTPPVPKAACPITQIRQTNFTAAALASIHTEPSSTVPDGQRRVPVTVIVPAVLLFVTVLLTARLLYNLRQLRRLAAGSEPIHDPGFRELAHQLWLQCGAESNLVSLSRRTLMYRSLFQPRVRVGSCFHGNGQNGKTADGAQFSRMSWRMWRGTTAPVCFWRRWRLVSFGFIRSVGFCSSSFRVWRRKLAMRLYWLPAMQRRKSMLIF